MPTREFWINRLIWESVLVSQINGNSAFCSNRCKFYNASTLIQQHWNRNVVILKKFSSLHWKLSFWQRVSTETVNKPKKRSTIVNATKRRQCAQSLQFVAMPPNIYFIMRVIIYIYICYVQIWQLFNNSPVKRSAFWWLFDTCIIYLYTHKHETHYTQYQLVLKDF